MKKNGSFLFMEMKNWNVFREDIMRELSLNTIVFLSSDDVRIKLTQLETKSIMYARRDAIRDITSFFESLANIADSISDLV